MILRSAWPGKRRFAFARNDGWGESSWAATLPLLLPERFRASHPEAEDAFLMPRELSGKTHEIITDFRVARRPGKVLRPGATADEVS